MSLCTNPYTSCGPIRASILGPAKCDILSPLTGLPAYDNTTATCNNLDSTIGKNLVGESVEPYIGTVCKGITKQTYISSLPTPGLAPLLPPFVKQVNIISAFFPLLYLVIYHILVLYINNISLSLCIAHHTSCIIYHILYIVIIIIIIIIHYTKTSYCLLCFFSSPSHTNITENTRKQSIDNPKKHSKSDVIYLSPRPK